MPIVDILTALEGPIILAVILLAMYLAAGGKLRVDVEKKTATFNENNGSKPQLAKTNDVVLFPKAPPEYHLPERVAPDSAMYLVDKALLQMEAAQKERDNCRTENTRLIIEIAEKDTTIKQLREDIAFKDKLIKRYTEDMNNDD